jgi:hypothetical protein
LSNKLLSLRFRHARSAYCLAALARSRLIINLSGLTRTTRQPSLAY